MKRISISLRDAKALRECLPRQGLGGAGAILRLEDAIARAERVTPGQKATKAKAAKKKRAKREETAAIYAEVKQRANGRCECGCGFPLLGISLFQPELDHFFPRRNGQSVESCWMLTRSCHRNKTNNNPSPDAWLERFIAHCERHGYTAEAERARRRLESLRLSAASAAVTRNTKESK